MAVNENVDILVPSLSLGRMWLLTVKNKSVPPDGGVGHQSLYAWPVDGSRSLTDEVLELAPRGEALAQVRVGQSEPRHGAGEVGRVRGGAGGGEAGG